MLSERWRTMLGGSSAFGNATAPAHSSAPYRVQGARNAAYEREVTSLRQSRGLEQFFANIRDYVGLSILDLSGVNQANVNFITSLGHKLYSEDFLRTLDETFAEPDLSDQSNPGRIDSFLRQNLDYPEEHFDGILVWDVLEYLSPPLLAATLDRLSHIVRSKSYLLAFFHVEDRSQSVPFYSFRIEDFNTLQVTQRGVRSPAQIFNNRSLEKLFQKFESVKFFLTRENLREVIIRR